MLASRSEFTPGMVAQAYNLGIQNTEARGSGDQDQPGLRGKFGTGLPETSSLKKKKYGL